MENLEAGELSQAWTPDGDPLRVWQVVNQLGFVTGLLEDSGDDKQEARDWVVPGTQCGSLEREQWAAGKVC